MNFWENNSIIGSGLRNWRGNHKEISAILELKSKHEIGIKKHLK